MMGSGDGELSPVDMPIYICLKAISEIPLPVRGRKRVMVAGGRACWEEEAGGGGGGSTSPSTIYFPHPNLCCDDES